MSYPPNITVIPQQPPQIFPPQSQSPVIIPMPPQLPPQSPVIIPIPYNNTPPQPQPQPNPYPQQPMGGYPPMMPMCPPMMPMCPPMMPMCPPPPCGGRRRRRRRYTTSRKRCPPGTRKVCTKHGSRMRCKCVGSGRCPPNRRRSPQYNNRCIPNTCPPGYRRNSIGECVAPPRPPPPPPPPSCGKNMIWWPSSQKCVRRRCLYPREADGTCPVCPPGKVFTRYGCDTVYQPPPGKIHIHGPGCRFGHACAHGRGRGHHGSRRGHHGRGSVGRVGRGSVGRVGRGNMGRHRSDNFLEVPNIKGLGPGVIENFEHAGTESPNYKFLAIVIILIIVGVFIYIMRQQNL